MGNQTDASKIPTDLGIKFGTKEEEFWTKVKTDAENMIFQMQKGLLIQAKLKVLAEDQLKIENLKKNQ